MLLMSWAYCNKGSGLNNRNLLSYKTGDWKSEIQVQLRLISFVGCE